MKFIIQVVVIALSSYVAEQFFPWWCVVICAFLTTLLTPTDNLTAFLSGFAAISFLWMLVAAIIDVKTKALLSSKITPFFGLQSPIIMILLTGLVGGIAGGLGALSGHQFRVLLFRKKRSKYC
jgi:hypothetical protein